MAERFDRPEVVLASGSRTRREMLHAAGLAFTVVPADIDETSIRDALLAGGAEIEAAEIAVRLARAKAETVSRDRPRALVIGADQILALGSEIFEKPRDIVMARECLLRLRGKAHQLHSAVALAEQGRVSWMHTSTAHLTMREFSTAALDDYLARAGPVVCEAVGAYQIEGPGIQLFDRIDGDYFTILGLSLLPLLEELRSRKALTA
jgi:septum formation protein